MLIYSPYALYFLTLFFYVGLDALWLITTHPLYKKNLAHLLSSEVHWLGALLFYPLYALGLFVFVIKPFDHTTSLMNVFVRGALFGLVAYGTYALTNYITLKQWPGFLVAVDMCWGAVVSAAVSVAAITVLKLITRS